MFEFVLYLIIPEALLFISKDVHFTHRNENSNTSTKTDSYSNVNIFITYSSGFLLLRDNKNTTNIFKIIYLIIQNHKNIKIKFIANFSNCFILLVFFILINLYKAVYAIMDSSDLLPGKVLLSVLSYEL